MIQPRPLDINTVIRHAQALLPPLLGENVELELRLAPDLGACTPTRGRSSRS